MQEFTTPMMKQYSVIKKQYEDCLLFFRAGDFYEFFLDDALIGSKVLNITLTSKAIGKDKRIPMAGVPFHAVDTYLSKLVQAGYKVAICEQISEPNKYGIVDRQVVRIVTPGTVLDENALEKNENNYIVAISFDKKNIGIAVADISTGQFQAGEFQYGDFKKIITDQLTLLHPSECILEEKIYNDRSILKILNTQKGLNIFCYSDWNIFSQNPKKILKKHFGISSVSFHLEAKIQAMKASAALLGYLTYTQKEHVKHFNVISELNASNHLVLDRNTILNLELFTTIREHDKKGTLIHLLDHTITAMGGRSLREWIRRPLTNDIQIKERHNAVEEYIKKISIRESIREDLKKISDLERILSRLSVGIGNARDIINLKNSLKKTIEIQKKSKSFQNSLSKLFIKSIPKEINELIYYIETFILEEPKFDVKGGGIIKSGIHKNLDELRKHIGGNKDWIVELEKSEKKKTGITSLKIRFNKVFGFYIEVSKSYSSLVPDNYIRKQTLVNGERFITPELKEKEELILTAEEKINKLEYSIFLDALTKLLEHTQQIQHIAHHIGILDCILNFAFIAEKEQYSKPIIEKKGELRIIQGRHPVVEKLLEEQQFVPNDVTLNNNDQQLLIITGPNMAGKSVFIRQVALIVLMNQIGSYVPAEKSNLPIVDKIFVRSGASDAITSGLSTFMVEMVETAQILNEATKDSLIIMDEIGRGTSTYDGISIARAVAEYLVKNDLHPKTLFATHYHELQTLENHFPKRVKNYHMAVEDYNDEPVFLHTLVSGGASHSYGVAVAKLAGIPDTVTKRAYEILHELERRDNDKTKNQISNIKDDNNIIEDLKNININNLTPLEALNMLAKLKKSINK